MREKSQTVPTTVLCGLLLIASPFTAMAAPPQIQSPSPVIYLVDNLDEKDELGWCIDTQGRGFSEILHAHSCKPRGGDTQFSYNSNNGQISSVVFEDKCMTLVDSANIEQPFGLLDCVEGETTQQFSYNEELQEITLTSNKDLCIVVGSSSRSAGPFMSRQLTLKACTDTETLFKQWVLQN